MIFYILGAGVLLILSIALITGIRITKSLPDQGSTPYLLVLGTTVNGTEPSIMLDERIEAAYRYLADHPDVICIPTGAKNPDADITEAQCIANKLIAKGIDPARIWIEPKATTTLNNLRCSLKLIEEKSGSRPEKISFITSDFHVFRTRLMAKRLGIPVCAHASRSKHTIFYYPAFLREIVAVWYYLLFAK
jgi:uncharacterized SAM-binding protein YcdF (DUF218 family)